MASKRDLGPDVVNSAVVALTATITTFITTFITTTTTTTITLGTTTSTDDEPEPLEVASDAHPTQKVTASIPVTLVTVPEVCPFCPPEYRRRYLFRRDDLCEEHLAEVDRPYQRICITCGERFMADRQAVTRFDPATFRQMQPVGYCSDECRREGILQRQRERRAAARPRRRSRPCERCGDEFVPSRSNAPLLLRSVSGGVVPLTTTCLRYRQPERGLLVLTVGAASSTRSSANVRKRLHTLPHGGVLFLDELGGSHRQPSTACRGRSRKA